MTQPLAERARPESLEEFFGQEKLIGQQSFLRQAIKNDQVPSLILWGPPGSGKTTLAKIISRLTQAEFLPLSAVASGKKDLMEIIKKAKDNLLQGKRTILFIDEIHRWNKAQQDALLPAVENGTVILIGATTENPSFEVVSALLSRTRVFVLEALENEDLEKILQQALKKIGEKRKIDKNILVLIAQLSHGDARVALGALEIALNQKEKVTSALIKDIFQRTNLLFDKNGEEHYNLISALHKSMRGGEADAAVYYLTRMLLGGEDPLYIARRLVRFASEDIGLANNTALILANSVFDACHKLGMPECGVHLTQCVAYLAKSPKSVAAYDAYEGAKKDAEKFGALPVPLHLRNAPTKLMKELNYGKGYKYTPKEDSSDQEYFPSKLKGRKYFREKLKNK